MPPVFMNLLANSIEYALCAAADKQKGQYPKKVLSLNFAYFLLLRR